MTDDPICFECFVKHVTGSTFAVIKFVSGEGLRKIGYVWAALVHDEIGKRLRWLTRASEGGEVKFIEREIFEDVLRHAA